VHFKTDRLALRHTSPASVTAMTGRAGFEARGIQTVGVAGFEPTAFRSQSGRATKLRHTPFG
jgi:hypothetical protein